MLNIIKELWLFAVTFIVIFSISFVALNYSSFLSMIDHSLHGEDKQEVLEADETKKVSKAPLQIVGAKKYIKKTFPEININVTPLDYRLIIPKIGKDVPLVYMSDKYISKDIWGEFENEIQDALKGGVLHYPGTSKPGEFGNTFLTGHSSYYPWDDGNYKDVFANLKSLNIGDEYYIYHNQKKFHYKVIETKEVYPTDINVLDQPQNKKLSTLMTCWPLGTTLKRIIVVAEEIS